MFVWASFFFYPKQLTINSSYTVHLSFVQFVFPTNRSHNLLHSIRSTSWTTPWRCQPRLQSTPWAPKRDHGKLKDIVGSNFYWEGLIHQLLAFGTVPKSDLQQSRGSCFRLSLAATPQPTHHPALPSFLCLHAWSRRLTSLLLSSSRRVRRSNYPSDSNAA